MAAKRNIISVVLVIISVVVLAYVLYHFDNSARFSKFYVDTNEFEQIISSRTQATNDLLDAVVFDDEKLFFDPSADTFYYSLQEGDSDAYNPYIKWGTHNNTSLVILEQDITGEVIKNNRTIQMLAYNDHEYKQYKLKCTTLPLLNINCSEEIISDIEKFPMDITLFDNRKGAVSKVTHSDGTIHVRGASAQSYPKKSFRFSLTQNSLGGNSRENHVSLLGMRQDDDWLLYAAYNDQEKIRNVFSSNLWKYSCDTDNQYKISTGTEYKYLELFINGEYYGLYALGYPIDEKLLGIDAEKNMEFLYKKGGYDERMLSITEQGILGYRLKNGADDENIPEYQTLLKECAPLIDYYQNLDRNSDNNEELLKGIDIDNAIDLYLFINLTQGLDTVYTYPFKSAGILTTNLYLTIKNDGGDLVAIYSPWDLDITWGNNYNGYVKNLTLPYDISPKYNRIMEWGYLYEILKNNDSDVWELIFDKYRQLRNTAWSEEFIADLLDEYEADIFYSGAYLRDMERWPDGTYCEADYDLSIFKEYVFERLKEADCYYERLEALHTKSIYVVRSVQYDNFLDNNFSIEINDKGLLLDSNYTDLLQYIGVDTRRITDDISYIIVNGEQQSVDYLPSLGEGENNSPAIRFLFGRDDEMSEFDFTSGYTFPKLTACTDIGSYLNDLQNTDYDILIEFKNNEILQDKSYIKMLEGIGIKVSDIRNDTDLIIIDGNTGEVKMQDHFYVSGNYVDTAFGQLTIFIDETGAFGNEAGTYGFYINSNELYIITPQEDENMDIRITLIDRQTLSMIDCVAFSYMLQLQDDEYILQTTGIRRKII